MLTTKQKAKRVFNAIKKESYLEDKIIEAQNKYDEYQDVQDTYLVDLKSELSCDRTLSVFEFKDECLVCMWDDGGFHTWVVYKE